MNTGLKVMYRIEKLGEYRLVIVPLRAVGKDERDNVEKELRKMYGAKATIQYLGGVDVVEFL